MAFSRSEEKAEFKKKVMVFFIAGIMILSVFGVIFYGFNPGSESSLTYNEFEFRIVDGLYRLDRDDMDIDFYFFPSEVLDYEVDERAIDVLKTRNMVYYTSGFNDPLNSTIALLHYNLAPIFESELSLYMIGAYTTDISDNFLTVDCMNATETAPVIFVRDSEESGIRMDDNCIMIDALSQKDLIGLHERILYELLGVIE